MVNSVRMPKGTSRRLWVCLSSGSSEMVLKGRLVGDAAKNDTLGGKAAMETRATRTWMVDSQKSA